MCRGTRMPEGSVAQTSAFEVCGSCSDSRFRMQGRTGNRQPAAAHSLHRTHAGILVHAGPLPGNGNLHRLSRRTGTNKTSQAARLKRGGLRYLALSISGACKVDSPPLIGVKARVLPAVRGGTYGGLFTAKICGLVAIEAQCQLQKP